MRTEPSPITLAEVVHKAVETCGDSDALDDLLVRFEDADQPISSVGDIEEVVAEAVGAIAADDPEPELRMAGAVIVYLAHRRDELGADPVELLTLAARAEFHGQPPPAIADWLEAQGAQAR